MSALQRACFFILRVERTDDGRTRAMPDSLKKLKAHTELFHGMQMFEQVLPSYEDLQKRYAVDA